jgi:MFS family permease
MVAGTYLLSAVLTAALGFALLGGGLTTLSFMAFVIAIFFVASAGASSAYLTVSEIFPMETRALSIAFFYAIGTAAGGIVGPLLFGHLIASGSESQVAIGFFIGAVVMAIGGIAELLFGVHAEQKQLEDIAEPLTAEGEGEGGEAEGAGTAKEKRAPKPASARGARRRYRSGPVPLASSRAMAVTGPHERVPLDQEVAIIEAALQEHGSANRRELRRRVGARYWGPGRFGEALREAVAEDRARRLPRGQFAPSHDADST